jgi:hypothetical protein
MGFRDDEYLDEEYDEYEKGIEDDEDEDDEDTLEELDVDENGHVRGSRRRAPSDDDYDDDYE